MFQMRVCLYCYVLEVFLLFRLFVVEPGEQFYCTMASWQKAHLMFSKPLIVLRFCLQHSRNQTCKSTYNANLLRWVLDANDGVECSCSPCLTYELRTDSAVYGSICHLCIHSFLKDWCCCEVWVHALLPCEHFSLGLKSCQGYNWATCGWKKRKLCVNLGSVSPANTVSPLTHLKAL